MFQYIIEVYQSYNGERDEYSYDVEISDDVVGKHIVSFDNIGDDEFHFVKCLSIIVFYEQFAPKEVARNLAEYILNHCESEKDFQVRLSRSSRYTKYHTEVQKYLLLS